MAPPKQQEEDYATTNDNHAKGKYCTVLYHISSKHSDAFLVLACPRPSTHPANVLSFILCVYRSDNGRDQRLRRSNLRRGETRQTIMLRPETHWTIQLDCRSSGRTRKINLARNQNSYDNSETTVGKLLARRIQIVWVPFL